jgi:CRP-like cAMP-binding protein
MKQLESFIFKYVQPAKDELSFFLHLVKSENPTKGRKIIKAGTVSDKIFFVKKGLLKYSMPQGNSKEKAMHIAMENDLVADFFSFYSGQPSITNVETLIECELLFVDKTDLQSLYDKYKIWERFGRLVAESAMLEQIMEKLNLQTKTAEQRYIELITKKPSLLREVNLGIIAECLGITQETLSRIRARI